MIHGNLNAIFKEFSFSTFLFFRGGLNNKLNKLQLALAFGKFFNELSATVVTWQVVPPLNKHFLNTVR